MQHSSLLGQFLGYEVLWMEPNLQHFIFFVTYVWSQLA